MPGLRQHSSSRPEPAGSGRPSTSSCWEPRRTAACRTLACTCPRALRPAAIRARARARSLSIAIVVPATGSATSSTQHLDLRRTDPTVLPRGRHHTEGRVDRAPVDGVLLTHAHVGHCLGLAFSVSRPLHTSETPGSRDAAHGRVPAGERAVEPAHRPFRDRAAEAPPDSRSTSMSGVRVTSLRCRTATRTPIPSGS